MASFEIVTFIIHGFGQGEMMAYPLCEVQKVDVLFLQESWLSPDLLHKLCFISEDYIMHGISAMDSVVSANTLVGRPFGGLATLIHNSHKDFIINHMCSERYNIISIGNLVLVNVYLPSTTRGDDTQLVDEILIEISNILKTIIFSHIIFAGDINCSPSAKGLTWKHLSAKINNLGVSHVPHLSDTYTFRQENLGHFSCIDHFFSNCFDSTLSVDNIQTIDNYINFLARLPVMLTLSGDVSNSCVTANIQLSNSVKQRLIKQLNWDSANLGKYYEL